MAFKNQTLSEFLEKVSSSSPTPGGGTVSAFVGAMAAALVMMVCSLTVGKKKYKDVEEQMLEIAVKAAQSKGALTALADIDAMVFEEVMSSRSDPLKYQEALQRATKAPCQVAQFSLDVLEMASQVLSQGNKNAGSDAEVAMALARAAVSGAIANMEINLKDITDREFKEGMRQKIENMRQALS